MDAADLHRRPVVIDDDHAASPIIGQVHPALSAALDFLFAVRNGRGTNKQERRYNYSQESSFCFFDFHVFISCLSTHHSSDFSHRELFRKKLSHAKKLAPLQRSCG
jgi:hypothetical protein